MQRYAKDNPTVIENMKPGTVEWQLQYTYFDNPMTIAAHPLNRRLRCSAIEGYSSKTSLYPGETIDFMVSMNPSGSFIIDFYRMGYYEGMGAREMGSVGPIKAHPKPMPMMSIERLRECDWDKSFSLKVPDDWPSGVYIAKFTRQDTPGLQNYVIFIVKSLRKTDLLCQVSDLTWQAYNRWPGLDSIYNDGTPDPYYVGTGVRVSFDRPYAKYCQVLDSSLSSGTGEYLLWEHPMTFWLEQQGYDVGYCSNLDLHMDPDVLSKAKVFVSVGHDEYWSRKMLEETIRARDDGLSIAFFSGNSVYWEIEFYDSSITGAPCRAFSRKQNFQDEDTLMGVKSYGPGYGDWVITNPDHWIYEKTGLNAGDKLPGIIGWEYHGTPADIDGLEIVASSQLDGCIREKLSEGPVEENQVHHGIVYPCDKGNWVFNAGTIWWPEGLSNPPGHIPARGNCGGTFGVLKPIQKITSNILDKMIGDSPRS